ncbi:class I lanthipeptide [Lacinutrix sp. Hel_I_90]|uniref:class I lanthipeptide n=1 Tax=Lacinutrix sp. Hel_I_90 TaxID=1249999 RepID=UPI000A893937|nr:class I lanthipeptide [Lacinutrix sp. Hel_I_90]
MKTQNTKLQFKKDSISELNDQQMIGVNGGDAVTFSFVENSKGDLIFWISVAIDD